MFQGLTTQKYFIPIFILFVLWILGVSVVILGFFRISNKNDKFENYIKENIDGIEAITEGYGIQEQTETQVFAFSLFKKNNDNENYTLFTRGIYLIFGRMISDHLSKLYSVDKNQKDRDTIPDGLIMKNFHECLKDMELTFLEKVGKFFRPELKICEYRRILDLLSSKSDQFVKDERLIAFTHLDDVYVADQITIDNLEAMLSKETNYKIPYADISLLNVFLYRNRVEEAKPR